MFVPDITGRSHRPRRNGPRHRGVLTEIYAYGGDFGWSVREGTIVFRREDLCHLYPLPDDEA